jgi:hypothetical protein
MHRNLLVERWCLEKHVVEQFPQAPNVHLGIKTTGPCQKLRSDEIWIFDEHGRRHHVAQPVIVNLHDRQKSLAYEHARRLKKTNQKRFKTGD